MARERKPKPINPKYELCRQNNEDTKNTEAALLKAADIAARNGELSETDVMELLESVCSRARWLVWFILSSMHPMGPKAYAKGLKFAFTTGNVFDDPLRCFRRADKLHLMDERERAVFEGLTPGTTIYRGTDAGEAGEAKGGKYGYFWTTRREVAEWYAFRNTDQGRAVIAVKVGKCEPLAYFADRGEYEIIADVPAGAAEVVTRIPTLFFTQYVKGRETV